TLSVARCAWITILRRKYGRLRVSAQIGLDNCVWRPACAVVVWLWPLFPEIRRPPARHPLADLDGSRTGLLDLYRRAPQFIRTGLPVGALRPGRRGIAPRPDRAAA